jgi:adenylate cyclase
MPSKLIVKDTETNRSHDYELTKEQTRIGRAADRSDLVLDSQQVSREHVIIKRVNDSYKLVDLGSANGTWMNGARVSERVLANGDCFTISKYNLEFKESLAAVAYDNKAIGNTIFMRTPGELTSVVPHLDKTALASADPNSKSVMTYIETLRKKAETLTRVYELNKLLASDLSLEAIFKKVSEVVFRLSQAERFLVLLKDARTGRLETVATEFANSKNAKSGEIKVSRTVIDRVITERVSLLSLDAKADEQLNKAQSIIMQGIRSVMCAPLLSKDEVLGVIYVDSQEAGKILRADDLDLLNAVAAQTSIAVDNAKAHERLLLEELARAKYRRFMPPHVIESILNNPEALNLGGTNSCVTVLFSDVRGFTSLSERLEPQTVVQMLNEYFSDMTPIVFKNNGMLDKYIGDGLMALFGVPIACDEAAANAVATAIAMQRQMDRVNQDLRAAGLGAITIGIGINTGMVTVGYIGSEERTDYTAIGDSVNLAARLEKQAKANQIIISRSTRDAIGDAFPVRPSGEISVKGREEKVQIFEVLWQEVGMPVRHTDPGV